MRKTMYVGDDGNRPAVYKAYYVNYRADAICPYGETKTSHWDEKIKIV